MLWVVAKKKKKTPTELCRHVQCALFLLISVKMAEYIVDDNLLAIYVILSEAQEIKIIREDLYGQKIAS